jgi:hypothetical protein
MLKWFMKNFLAEFVSMACYTLETSTWEPCWYILN